jgi:hypothetical protein
MAEIFKECKLVPLRGGATIVSWVPDREARVGNEIEREGIRYEVVQITKIGNKDLIRIDFSKRETGKRK